MQRRSAVARLRRGWEKFGFLFSGIHDAAEREVRDDIGAHGLVARTPPDFSDTPYLKVTLHASLAHHSTNPTVPERRSPAAEPQRRLSRCGPGRVVNPRSPSPRATPIHVKNSDFQIVNAIGDGGGNKRQTLTI